MNSIRPRSSSRAMALTLVVSLVAPHTAWAQAGKKKPPAHAAPAAAASAEGKAAGGANKPGGASSAQAPGSSSAGAAASSPLNAPAAAQTPASGAGAGTPGAPTAPAPGATTADPAEAAAQGKAASPPDSEAPPATGGMVEVSGAPPSEGALVVAPPTSAATPAPAGSPPAGEATKDDPDTIRKVALIATGAATAIAAGVGITFGALYLDAKSQFDKSPTGDLASEAEDRALVADVGLGGTIVFGSTFLMLILTKPSAPDSAAPAGKAAATRAHPASSFTAVPTVTRGGAGVAATLRF